MATQDAAAATAAVPGNATTDTAGGIVSLATARNENILHAVEMDREAATRNAMDKIIGVVQRGMTHLALNDLARLLGSIETPDDETLIKKVLAYRFFGNNSTGGWHVDANAKGARAFIADKADEKDTAPLMELIVLWDEPITKVMFATNHDCIRLALECASAWDSVVYDIPFLINKLTAAVEAQHAPDKR